jgi:hypothetical protein
LVITILLIQINRLKDVAQKQYTQKEAEMGAGKSVEKYISAHPQHKMEE